MTDEVKVEAPTLTEQVVAAAPPATAVEPYEVTRLRAENEELKRAAITAKAEAEDKVSELRLKAARAIARKPVEVVRSNVQQDMAFDKLRSTLGGNCFVNNLTPAQQLESIGIVGSEQIKDSEVKIYFGKSSDGAKANALRRADPERYSMLRAISKARNIY
jgi:hypothetical protein